MKIAQIHNLLRESFKSVEENEEIMGNFNLNDNLHSSDNYAPGDLRTPKLLGKVQKRKKDEDSEKISHDIFYRYMSINELQNILSFKAFKEPLDFDDDSAGLRKNPAGDLPFCKCFTTKITRPGLDEFMGPDHVIVLFDPAFLAKTTSGGSKCKLIPYTFDNNLGAIHEYEYRLFSKDETVPINPGKAIKGIIFCPEGGDIDAETIEEVLLDLDYSGVDMKKRGNARLIRSWKPLRQSFLYLSEDDTLVSTK